MELSKRKLKILSSIIDIYIATGDPVGSKLIAESIGVSSATIRNEMAELIEMGYLLQPHTSAGRIPSERGFREYLNSRSDFSPLSPDETNFLSAAIKNEAFNKEQLIKKTAEALSFETGFLTAVTEPESRGALIKAVQFVQVSRRKAMLILITSQGGIKTKLFKCEYDLNSDIMRVFFRIFNEKVTGKHVYEVTPAFIQSFAISLGDMIALLTPALLTFYEATKEMSNINTCIKGELSLLNYPEFTTKEIKSINEIMLSPTKFLPVKNLKQGKTNVLLGSETGKQELKDAALLTTSYEIAGTVAGSITVLGPMRMDFGKTSAKLSFAAKALSDMLTLLTEEI